ncbi:MAG: cysteine synthase A [Thermodesulfobacteriota bacterium]
MTLPSQSLTDSIGSTPLIKLSNIAAGSGATILAKQESRNPLGSVKDRIALSMIEAAMDQGQITEQTTIIEPTSGNTGLGLAFVCAAKGLSLVLTMPESMSIERRQLLTHLGAKLILTPATEGMRGAIEKAGKVLAETGNGFMPNQFSNPANPEIHRQTTGPEIWEQSGGKVDIFIAGIGTGGTITGAGEFLKENNPTLTVIGVEPADSPILSGGSPGPHKIQGIGAGFVPEILNRQIIDEMITVSDTDAFQTSRNMATREGVLCGISSGAAAWAALQIGARPEHHEKTIVTVLPDTGERYLSTDLFS